VPIVDFRGSPDSQTALIEAGLRGCERLRQLLVDNHQKLLPTQP
jgi:hypothetical protein